jgi:hypothetical protein
MSAIFLDLTDFNVKVAIIVLWMAFTLVVLALLASFARTSLAERWVKKGADSLATIRSFCCYMLVPMSRRYEYSEKEFEVSSSFDRESIDELTAWTPSPAAAAEPVCTSLYIADSTAGGAETHGDADESAARKESAKFQVYFQSTSEASATTAALDDECVSVAAWSESTPLSASSKSPFRSYTS